MNKNSNQIDELLRGMDFAPTPERERAIFDKVTAPQTAAPGPARRKRPVYRTALLAVVLAAAMCATAVFAAEMTGMTDLTGFIKSLSAGTDNITVNALEPLTPTEYVPEDDENVDTDREAEQTALPEQSKPKYALPEYVPEDADVENYGGFFMVGDHAPVFGNGTWTTTLLESLEEAREHFALEAEGVPFLVSEYPNAKVRNIAYRHDGITERHPSMVISYGHFPGEPEYDQGVPYYNFTQEYVGDAPVRFDLIGEITQVTVSGHDAILWSSVASQTDDVMYNLIWIQDGVLITVLPVAGYSLDEAIALAESLVPME